MKKFFVLTLIMAGVFNIAVSQPGRHARMEERMKELDAQRIAYLTEKLSLTQDEAEKFWPIYNDYNKKRLELMKSHRSVRQADIDWETITDAEAQKFADDEILRMEQNLALKKEFHNQIKKVLPIKKVALFYDADRGYNRHLLREHRGQKRGYRNGGGGLGYTPME